MNGVTEQTITGVESTANPGENLCLWISFYMKKPIFATDPEELPQQRKFIDITADPIEEYDLAPELSLSSAAEITKRFITRLPEDLIDADLGPGL